MTEWVNILGVLLSSAFACILGVALGIIAVASPEKRKKYMLKVLGFYLGLFLGLALLAFFQELIDHHERRKAFKQWKISKIFPKEKMFP